MSEPISARTATMDAQSGVDAGRGRARSRRNAVQHGLAATTLLAELFGHDLLERSKERLSNEWCPSTPTEEILVAELARHAAALVLVEQCEAAVLRNGARGVLSLSSSLDASDTSGIDALLAGAVTTEAIERLTRYRRSHEKAWHAALLRLRDVKGTQASASHPVPQSDVVSLSRKRHASRI
jgi:hypothetical protein